MAESVASWDRVAARGVVLRALDEDVGAGDVTTGALPEGGVVTTAAFVARQPGVLAGLDLLELVFAAVSERLGGGYGPVEVERRCAEGEAFEAGRTLAVARGEARTILVGERTALNLLQRLTGIATLTRAFVEAAEGGAQVIDTRKTTPGLRALEKYAVRAGGAVNHRMGLYDEAMVKDNHLALLARAGGPAGRRAQLKALCARIRERRPKVRITVEADDLAGVADGLAAEADVILLDNMSQPELREAVAFCRERAPEGDSGLLLEASGGVSLATIGEIAASGVDRISVGALTHQARSVDIGLDLWRGSA